MPPIALYHQNCTDGTTAAAVFLYVHPSGQAFPVPPSFTAADLAPALQEAGAAVDVYVLDCTGDVAPLLDTARSVTVIDHHISANEEWEARAACHSRLQYIFDNKRSGATLAWQYFVPGEQMPEWFSAVEVLDTRGWDQERNVQAIGYALRSLRNDPVAVRAFFTERAEVLAERGNPVVSFAEGAVEKFLREAAPILLSIGEYRVPAYNSTAFKSLLADPLISRHDSAVALYSIVCPEEVRISFRSTDAHTPSALALAEALGGGGHRNAAAALVSFDALIAMRAHE